MDAVNIIHFWPKANNSSASVQLSGFPSWLEDQKSKQADLLIKPLPQAQTKQSEIYVQNQQNHYA